MSGIDSNSALPSAEGFVDLMEPFNDYNKNGVWDDGEVFNDVNGNKSYDDGEPYNDVGNGVWDEGEHFVDLDGNGAYDEWDEFEDKGNGKWDPSEQFNDVNKNRIWDGVNKIYDDLGTDEENPNVVICSDPNQTFENAQAIITLTEWDAFKENQTVIHNETKVFPVDSVEAQDIDTFLDFMVCDVLMQYGIRSEKDLDRMG